MSTEVLDNLIKQAEMLSPDGQLRLVAYLVERARQSSSSPRRKWHEMRGLARPALAHPVHPGQRHKPRPLLEQFQR
jgi:hypothetical protein